MEENPIEKLKERLKEINQKAISQLDEIPLIHRSTEDLPILDMVQETEQITTLEG